MSTYRTGRAVSEGVRTVICGRTNAGKSSIYNLIVGRQAAIVTDIEGTTRDILEETAQLGRVTLRLCDTAGLRDTEDRVESIGVERAKDAMRAAELILAVFDGTKPFDSENDGFISELCGCGGCVIALINKSDSFESADGRLLDRLGAAGIENIVYVSAKSGEGLSELGQRVDDCFTDGSIDLRHDAVLTDAMQHTAVSRAAERLAAVRDAMVAGYELDLCCIDAEAAMNALGEINGRNVNDDIVSSIFSKFCVGK